jgi:hypothetical protein
MTCEELSGSYLQEIILIPLDGFCLISIKMHH